MVKIVKKVVEVREFINHDECVRTEKHLTRLLTSAFPHENKLCYYCRKR